MKRFFKKYKLFKIITLILLFILIALILFLKLWLPFGGLPSGSDKKGYSKRASNYINNKFQNLEFTTNGGKNNFASLKGKKPIDKIPVVKPNLIKDLKEDDFTITWLGHSSLLIQIQKMNILFDPVFSDKVGPISFTSYKRFSDMPINIDELPNIDILIITHDHYDHLDYETIKKIDSKVNTYIVPLGVENHLERWGVNKNRIKIMAWWKEIEINDLKIICTPAKHNSGRSINMNNTLWSSWILKNKYYQIYEVSDSGFGGQFFEINKRYGNFDLALIGIGEYDVKWKDIHMTPEEAIEASKVLGVNVVMPIHYGTFKLANHPWDDPIERFYDKAIKDNVNYVSPIIGETVYYNNNKEYRAKWWENIR